MRAGLKGLHALQVLCTHSEVVYFHGKGICEWLGMELRQVRNDLPERGRGRGSMNYFDKLLSGLEVSPPPPPPCCSTEYAEQRGRLQCRGIGLPRFMLAYVTFILTIFSLYGLELLKSAASTAHSECWQSSG